MEKIVGTAGHIDHGKTALIKALTGTDADRLPEEKRRGITVDLGFAEMSAGDVHFGFVDVPGHERFVKNMLAGASGIDIVILVVAADDGVMPQTHEHFDICRLLDIRSGVIAITKTDLVDAETLDLAKMDVAELVAGSFLDGVPIVPVSSRSGEGIDELRVALVTQAERSTAFDDGLITRLPIDRSFAMKGFGAVVTGTLASGEIADGAEMELLPQSRRVRARGLQSHGKAAASVNAGQRVAVNLAGIDHHEIERGMLLTEPGVLIPTQILDVEIEMLHAAAKPLRSRQRVRLHLGTSEILARVKVLGDKPEIRQGGRELAQLTLEGPVAAVPGERFIIRSYSPQITIGGGAILDNAPARHRPRDLTSVRQFLGGLLSAGTPGEKIACLISASKVGLSMQALRSRTGFRDDVILSAISDLGAAIVAAGDHFVDAQGFDHLLTAGQNAIGKFHKLQPLAKGLSREELRDQVFRNIPEPIFQYAIARLVRDKRIVSEGDTVRLTSFSNVLSSDESKVSETIRREITTARLAVPKIDELLAAAASGTQVTPAQARKLLQMLLNSREVVKVSDEFHFSRAAIENVTQQLRDFAEASTDRLIDVGQFKDLAGVSRKYAIPLLEYFDREKITVRTGEKRLIR